jgi:hypothetical protein
LQKNFTKVISYHTHCTQNVPFFANFLRRCHHTIYTLVMNICEHSTYSTYNLHHLAHSCVQIFCK